MEETKKIIVAFSNSNDIRKSVGDGFQCDLILDVSNPLYPHYGTITDIHLPKSLPFTVVFIVDGKISICPIHKYSNERDKFVNYSTNKLQFTIYRTKDDKYMIAYIILKI